MRLKNITLGSSKNWPPLGEELSNSCARTRSLERLSRWTEQESRTCRVAAFVSIERVRYSTRSVVEESHDASRRAQVAKEEWRRMDGRTIAVNEPSIWGRRSVDDTCSETIGRCCATHRVAHHLSSEEIIITVLRAIQNENTMFNLAFRSEGHVGDMNDHEVKP